MFINIGLKLRYEKYSKFIRLLRAYISKDCTEWSNVKSSIFSRNVFKYRPIFKHRPLAHLTISNRVND